MRLMRRKLLDVLSEAEFCYAMLRTDPHYPFTREHLPVTRGIKADCRPVTPCHANLMPK